LKKIGLSLAAVLLAGTYVQADIKLVDIGGSASLFYDTNDGDGADLFDKGELLSGTAYGNVAAEIHGTSQLGKCDCTKLNFGVTGVSTMGLEGTLVNNTWVDQSLNTDNTNTAMKNYAPGNINDGIWIDTLNLQFSPLDGISNTTMIVGRQALATPFVFTETWSIAKNTFDAAVAVNNDIKETTIVGAWVGRSNGIDAVDRVTEFNTNTLGMASVVRTDGISDNAYTRFLTDEGAYAFGAITKLIPHVDAQAWYYIAPSTATMGMLQLEGGLAGFSLGGQYAMLDVDLDDTDGSAFAVKAGYDYEGLGLKVAYSSVDEMTGTAAGVKFQNLGGLQSPLYTEAWWNYGYVGASNTDTISASASYSMENIADLGLYYTMADNGDTDQTMQEITVTAGKDFGNLNATLAYINSDYDDGGDAVNEIQAYLTYSF
jgi:imipenem/basic amino acid-specific outer membrane pore